eukprot:1146041-Pelagomonas_calceolata.AAC.19
MQCLGQHQSPPAADQGCMVHALLHVSALLRVYLLRAYIHCWECARQAALVIHCLMPALPIRQPSSRPCTRNTCIYIPGQGWGGQVLLLIASANTFTYQLEMQSTQSSTMNPIAIEARKFC